MSINHFQKPSLLKSLADFRGWVSDLKVAPYPWDNEPEKPREFPCLAVATTRDNDGEELIDGVYVYPEDAKRLV